MISNNAYIPTPISLGIRYMISKKKYINLINYINHSIVGKKVLHIIPTYNYSGAENVAITIIDSLKKKYNLKECDKNECGFYHISNEVEIVPNSKENFKMEYKDGYPVESLKTILAFKEKRNAPKDQKDIKNIKKYLKEKRLS